jgi:hypothetical protein
MSLQVVRRRVIHEVAACRLSQDYFAGQVYRMRNSLFTDWGNVE